MNLFRLKPDLEKSITFQPLSDTTHIEQDPPIPAIKCIPQWYKDIPPYFEGDNSVKVIPGFQNVNSTIKQCVPFLEGMTVGYTFVLSDDIQVQKIDGLSRIYWRTTFGLITDHGAKQYPGFPIPNGYGPVIYKWENAWRIITAPGYSLLCTHPINRYDLPFLTYTGFVESDDYTLSIKFPFILKDDFEGIIPRGTPVAQLIPVKRDNWISSIRPFDKEEKIRNDRQFFGRIERAYKHLFWKKKSYR